MKRIAGLLVLTLALVAVAPAPAQDTPSAVRAAIQAATARSGQGSADKLTEWSGLAEQLKKVEQCEAGSSVDDCLREATRFRDQARNPEIVSIWSNVVVELQAQKVTREEKLLADISAALGEARDACRKAKTADDLDGVVTRLVDLQGQRTRATPRVSTRLRYIDSAFQFVQLWQQCLLSAELGDVAGGQQAIQSMIGMSQVVVPRDEIIQLRTRIGTDDETIIRRADDALAAAGKACKTAKKPEELRAAVDALVSVQQLRQGYSGSRFQTRLNAVERAIQLLDNWSVYLGAAAGGDPAGARQALQEILNQYGSSERLVLPRADIEARLAELSAPGASDEVAALLKGAKLEDLPALAARAQSVSERGRDFSGRQYLVNALQNMASCEAALECKRPTEALSFLAQSGGMVAGPSSASLQALRAKLEARVLKLAFDLDVSADAAGGPLAEVSRLADDAAGKSDWPKLQRLLTVLVALPAAPANPSSGELAACQFYLAGLRFEAAGLWTDAVDCYRRELAQPGRRCPHDAATQHLQKLLKDHPESQPRRGTASDSSTAFLDGAGTSPAIRSQVYWPGYNYSAFQGSGSIIL